MRPPLWLGRLWSTDRSLSVLLGSLVVLIFVVPALRSRPEAPLLVQIFITLVFVSGLSATTPRRAARVVGTLVLTGAITLHWLDYFNPRAGLGAWAALGHLLRSACAPCSSSGRSSGKDRSPCSESRERSPCICCSASRGRASTS